ncbi:MAG: aminotransferase class IV [Syntrophobacteraceae bacterium]
MSESIRTLSFDEVVDRLIALSKPYHGRYLAMYSSWYDGIVTDPALMMVPIDDHLVHRGDGIFEAFKCVGGKVYALDRHVDRLEHSATGLFLRVPLDRSQLIHAVLATIRATKCRDCLTRLFISRGPGGFSTNPYECPESQLYIVVTDLSLPQAKKYELGVTLKSSQIPVKKAYFAKLKSCNYLPNVLMKKEAEDAGVDFTVSTDDNGWLGEGATENFGIITGNREFLVPKFERVLRGVTVTRMMELARSLVSTGDLTRVEETNITPQEAYAAAEIMMFGTSFDVLPVVDFDGHVIGDGRPGPFSKKFLILLRDDIRNCSEMSTPVGI